MAKDSGLKAQIEWYLKENHRGINNSVKLKHIPVGEYNKRNVRRAIHKLRIDGVPICSYNDGYFFAETTEEIDLCIMYIDSMATRIREAIAGLEQSKESIGD